MRFLRSLKTPTLAYSTHKTKKEREGKSTVDTDDLKVHERSTVNWWDPNGPVGALHALNELRIPFLIDGLVHVPPNQRTSTPLTGKKILDIGCGGGILSMPLAKLGAQVTGVDASEELIKVAHEHSQAQPVPGNQPTYLCTTIEEHAKDHANFYDGVFASEVIEHVDNDKKELFVASCIHTLKPGGKIFFTAPTRTRLSQFISIWLCENVLNAIPKDTHQYEKLPTPNEIKSLLEKNGCHIEVVRGIYHNVFQNRWNWTRSTSLFVAVQAIKGDDS